MDAQGKPFCEPTWPTIPPVSKLELGYSMMMRSRQEAQSANPEWRKLSRLIEWRNQEVAQAERDHKENIAILRDAVKPIFASSLEAQRIRGELEKRAMERAAD